MNATQEKGNWMEQKGKLEQKFAVLTENDQLYEEGRKKVMLGRTQIKFGKTKEDLLKIISRL